MCTLGPATTEPESILRLAEAGMDVARLNFSHGTHEEHLARLRAVRAAEEQIGRPIAVLGDLCGPKIRVAGLEEPVLLVAGETLVLTEPGEARAGEIAVTVPGLARIVRPGQEVLIDDGRIRAIAERSVGGRLFCRVEIGGTVSPSKGVNLPATELGIPALTAKDEIDLAFALRHGIDFVALSFVRTAEDVLDLRSRIDAAGSEARIVAKIEKAEAMLNLDAIIDASDVVMVARGDLGVEIGVPQVPLLQKQIIRRAREKGCAVITATQMLESMIHEAEPTRAEASDIANAVLDGTSAIMLSAETAAGDHPLRAVAVMDTIARTVERSLPYDRVAVGSDETSEILAHTACDLADDMHAGVVAVSTSTGKTARQVARCRPQCPIVAAAASPTVLRQLALEWAVVPVALPDPTSVEDGWAAMLGEIVERGLADAGDTIVLAGRSDAPLVGTTTHVSVHRMDAGR